MKDERRSSGSQFYIAWGQEYNEGQLRHFSKQLRMQQIQTAFNDKLLNIKKGVVTIWFPTPFSCRDYCPTSTKFNFTELISIRYYMI